MKTWGTSLLLALALSTPALAETPSAGAEAAEQAKATLAEHPTLVDMLNRNNELRMAYGRAPQEMSLELCRAAQDHAWYMARTGSFSHYSNGGPDGRSARYGYNGGTRENIALGQRTVVEVFSSWQGSSGHWANILSDSNIAGFGYAIGPNGQQYWVGVYGQK